MQEKLLTINAVNAYKSTTGDSFCSPCEKGSIVTPDHMTPIRFSGTDLLSRTTDRRN